MLRKKNLKAEVIRLRKSGKTYSEIINALKKDVPKSTLSFWCTNIKLSKEQRERIGNIRSKMNLKAREKALIAKKHKQQEKIEGIRSKINHLKKYFSDINVRKIALFMLYLGEGSKKTRSSLVFCNSSPEIIRLFLFLLRSCYSIDEDKFRCTVQCRADQDTAELEKFWSNITEIKAENFYKTRTDRRTIGKKTRNVNYKGVCRLDYFSADVFNEIMEGIKVLNDMGR